MNQHVLALKYPDRAESVDEFERYRVFLDHWQPLIDGLKPMRHALYARRDSAILGVYAPQGSGKTLFARRLRGDILKSRDGEPIDAENLWHRIGEERLSDNTSRVASTQNLRIFMEDSGSEGAKWMTELSSQLSGSSAVRAIVLLDEADQGYLQRQLLSLSFVEQLQADPDLLQKASAERLVKLCRTSFRGVLFIMLSNNRGFLDAFAAQVNAQHAGMMRVTDLPQADAGTKEKVVRINTNRLNEFSYWYCINNAVPARKEQIYDALHGAGTYPEAFRAVDDAISSADQTRMGRPATKNNLTLCVFHEQPDYSALEQRLGRPNAIEFDHPGCKILLWTDRWASKLGLAEPSGSMLATEWNLRVVLIGPYMTGSLVSGTSVFADVKKAFSLVLFAPSPYAYAKTVAALHNNRSLAVDVLCLPPKPAPAAFWDAGQGRSNSYEPILKAIFPTYNTGVVGFRPDLILRPYRTCSVLGAGKRDALAIRYAIRRDANFVEVTARRSITGAVVDYLGEKARNYVRLMESL